MTAVLVGLPTTTTGGAGSSLAVNLPASPIAGNLLLMLLGFWSTAPGDPSGWALSHVTANTASMRLAVYTRTVTGSEGATVAVNGYVADDPRTAIVLQASGAGGVDVVDSALAATPFNCPAIVTTMANDLVLVSAFTETQGTSTFDDFPAGTTTLTKLKTAVVGGYAGMHSLGSRAQAVAGSTGTTTVTATGTGMSTSVAVLTLAVKPASVDSTQFFRLLR